MLNEFKLIAEQLRTTFHGRAWHGPSFMDALKGVDSEEASRRPIEGRHSIWEIANHCAYWMEAVKRALSGDEMPRITPDSTEDWPQMGETEEEWIKARDNIGMILEDLVNSIEGFDSSRLEDIVPGRSYTYRNMLHGISDHNVYHTGQIAVFRKKT